VLPAGDATIHIGRTVGWLVKLTLITLGEPLPP